MKRKPKNVSRQYRNALRNCLTRKKQSNSESARGLARDALAAGLKTQDLARLHEQVLLTEVLPKCPASKRKALIRQAGRFFAIAITPIENASRDARDSNETLTRVIEMLSQRTVELAAANLEFNIEIDERRAAEQALRKRERHYSELLARSDQLQGQLRRLSRQLLSAQEDERKKISRELHDVIAQTLTGINLRLATLKREAAMNRKGLDRNIARTERLVEQSVEIVHKFARELRPAVLDDLGLIPALHTFMKQFSKKTGVRTHLSAFGGVEELDTTKRTALFRVAQEALINVERHARASRVVLSIRKRRNGVSMSISDNGRSFIVNEALQAFGRRHLGLLGMQERMEMVGGSFSVESAPGKGTIVEARLPFGKKRARAGIGTRQV